MRGGEVLRPRRVAHLAVQHDDIRAGAADRGQRLAERVPGRHQGPGLIAGQVQLASQERVRPLALGRRLHLHPGGPGAA